MCGNRRVIAVTLVRARAKFHNIVDCSSPGILGNVRIYWHALYIHRHHHLFADKSA